MQFYCWVKKKGEKGWVIKRYRQFTMEQLITHSLSYIKTYKAHRDQVIS